MMGRTHLVLGLLVAFALLPFVVPDHVLVYVLLVLFGSLLPDVDHSGSKINRLLPITRWIPWLFRHRGFFHSVFPVLMIYVIAWWRSASWVGMFVGIGYLVHLLSDACTRQGVNLLHPFSRLQLRGFLRTGSVAEVVLFLVVLVADVMLGLSLVNL